uniref:Uncharacterized protein n=1 Tax=Rhizophora mucronata TaxID=61149 RepID=A0A2P2PL69_RHIMU
MLLWNCDNLSLPVAAIQPVGFQGNSHIAAAFPPLFIPLQLWHSNAASQIHIFIFECPSLLACSAFYSSRTKGCDVENLKYQIFFNDVSTTVKSY